MTAVLDVFPQLRPRKTGVIAVLCIIFYLIGLTMCTSGGLYVLVLLDTFGSGWNVLLIAVLECIAIAWIYCKFTVCFNRTRYFYAVHCIDLAYVFRYYM